MAKDERKSTAKKEKEKKKEKKTMDMNLSFVWNYKITSVFL